MFALAQSPSPSLSPPAKSRFSTSASFESVLLTSLNISHRFAVFDWLVLKDIDAFVRTNVSASFAHFKYRFLHHHPLNLSAFQRAFDEYQQHLKTYSQRENSPVVPIAAHLRAAINLATPNSPLFSAASTPSSSVSMPRSYRTLSSASSTSASMTSSADSSSPAVHLRSNMSNELLALKFECVVNIESFVDTRFDEMIRSAGMIRLSSAFKGKDVPMSLFANSSVEELVINHRMKKPFPAFQTMNQLKTLTFNAKVRWHISAHMLPPNLECLRCFESVAQVDGNALPSALQVLWMSDYRQRIQLDELQQLSTLKLESYDQKLASDTCPQSLTYLRLREYNRSLEAGVLPCQLQVLELGHEEYGFLGRWNQPLLPNVLPDSLRKLVLSADFNHPIHPRVLPDSLEELYFGREFNQSLEPQSLPMQLRRLHFSKCSKFNARLQPFVLPDSLRVLHLGAAYFHRFTQQILPQTLTELEVGRKYLPNFPSQQDNIPDSVQRIFVRKANYDD